MYGLVLLGAFCPAAAAQDAPRTYDHAKPGFWQKPPSSALAAGEGYFVQISTVTRQNAEAAVQLWFEKAGAKKAGREPGNWTIPKEKAADAMAFIMAQGSLRQYYRKNAAAAGSPDEAESRYKLEKLTEERTLLAGREDRLPGILGLLDMEIRELRTLLDNYKTLKETTRIEYSIQAEGK